MQIWIGKQIANPHKIIDKVLQVLQGARGACIRVISRGAVIAERTHRESFDSAWVTWRPVKSVDEVELDFCRTRPDFS